MSRLLIGLGFCLACFGQEGVVELTGPRIQAKEIFEGAEAGVDLGPSPAPGARRRVTRAQLVRWARLAGAPEEDLPGSILLERKLKRWPEVEAADLVRGLVADAAATGPEAVEVELQGYGEMRSPAGTVAWSLLGLPDSFRGPARLALRWSEEGGRAGVESLTATIRVRVRALVASEDLTAGGKIDPSMLVLKELDMEGLRDRYVSEIQPDERWTLVRDVKSGEALREDLLRRLDDVERGAVVELFAARGAVRLRAPGRAEGSGSVGELIPFRNLATDRRVLARVESSKTAKVVGQ